MITLVTLTQGNPVALRRTADSVLQSFGGMLNEVVVGDVSVIGGAFSTGFEDLRMVELPFNYLFKNGFSDALNLLASRATNDLCLYLNVGEVVDKNLNTSLIGPEFNSYCLNHATDPHIWVRMWDRRRASWSGPIHEEIVGDRRLCPTPIFRFADTPKDSEDDFSARVYNDIKEMVYFQQYVRLAEGLPRGGTDPGWVAYSKKEVEDFRRRLREKGDRYHAFVDGDLQAYLAAAHRDELSKEWSKP